MVEVVEAEVEQSVLEVVLKTLHEVQPRQGRSEQAAENDHDTP